VGTTLVYLTRNEGPPKSSTVFDDAFADTRTGWTGGSFTPGASTYGYLEGRYRMVTTSEYRLHDEVGSPYKNAEAEWRIPSRSLISVTVRMSGTPSASAGLSCFGPGSHEEGYRFLVRADGQGIVLRRVTKDRGTAEIGTRPEAAGFSPGGENRLQVACEKQGSSARLRMWINGTLALEELDEDGALTEGTTGLLIEQTAWDGKGLTADFDDFQIAGIR